MVRCHCITEKGIRCKRNASKGSLFCFQHKNCKNSISGTVKEKVFIYEKNLPKPATGQLRLKTPKKTLIDINYSPSRARTPVGYVHGGMIKPVPPRPPRPPKKVATPPGFSKNVLIPKKEYRIPLSVKYVEPTIFKYKYRGKIYDLELMSTDFTMGFIVRYLSNTYKLKHGCIKTKDRGYKETSQMMLMDAIDMNDKIHFELLERQSDKSPCTSKTRSKRRIELKF